MASPYAGRAAAKAAANNPPPAQAPRPAPAPTPAPAPVIRPPAIAPLPTPVPTPPSPILGNNIIPVSPTTPGGSSVNLQTGQVFQNATTGPYTYNNAVSNGYVAPVGVITNAPPTATPTQPKAADYSPAQGSLGYFTTQAGGDRAKGLEMYKEAQAQKQKVVITPLSERQKKEKELMSNANQTPRVTPPTPPTPTPPLPVAPPIVPPQKKTEPKVETPANVPTVDGEKTSIKYWRDQGKTYQEAVALVKTERATIEKQKADSKLSDLRTDPDKDIQDQFINTAKIIAENELATKTEEERRLINDRQLEFNAKDKELDTEVSNWNALFTSYSSDQQKVGNEFESNRLNQVRSGILQRLASKGINIANISPEQLLALSGEVGAVAFKDISEKKMEIVNKISAKEQEKMLSLNDLRSRKVLNEAQYNSAVTTIKATADAQRTQINTTFNTNAYNILFAKTQNDQTTGTTLATNINALLSQYGVNAELAPKFSSVLGAASLGDAQAQIVAILAKDPTLAKSLDDARKSTTAANLVSQGNLAINQATFEDKQKKEAYDRENAILLKKYEYDKPTLELEQRKLQNSIYGTTGGGSSATSSPWL